MSRAQDWWDDNAQKYLWNCDHIQKLDAWEFADAFAAAQLAELESPLTPHGLDVAARCAQVEAQLADARSEIGHIRAEVAQWEEIPLTNESLTMRVFRQCKGREAAESEVTKLREALRRIVEVPRVSEAVRIIAGDVLVPSREADNEKS
jgi:hypothetical protein